MKDWICNGCGRRGETEDEITWKSCMACLEPMEKLEKEEENEKEV